MHTPKPSEDNSPQDENFPDEIEPIYNPATQNRPMMLMDEDEFLYLTSALIEPQYNPVTMSGLETDEDK